MGSYVQAEDEVPVYESGAEALQKLQEKWKSTAAPFPAMYSSVLGGIILDPAMMVLPIDDHMVHRGHGVFDTAMLLDGHLYELDPHLDRFLRSAAKAKVGTPVPARHAPQHPRPDDRRLRLPQGLHPLLAQLRPRRLPALLQRLPQPGLLRRRHPLRLRAVPPRRQGRHHLRAHEAAAVRHQQERQLPPQRALHHGRRGARRIRVRVGGRAGVRRGGTHGERRVRHPWRRARAPGVRQDPQRLHRQAPARARAQARRIRPAHGRQHQVHHSRRCQELRRDGFRRQRPARAAGRRVGRPAHRRREGGEADAGAVGSALGGHEVRPGQGRSSLQVKFIRRASEILCAQAPCEEPNTVTDLCVRAELHQCVVRTVCHLSSS